MGQIYLGQKKKGIALIVAVILTSCIGFSFIINLVGAIDAYSIAEKLNEGISVGEWEFSFSWKAIAVTVVLTVALAVVILGISVLANTGA